MAPLLPLPAIGQPGTDVDEPLNNLDLRHAVELMRLLRRMSSELGRTVVLVVHDVNVASCYSDRIVAMRNRRVLAAGPTEELMVAELLGEVFDVDVPVHPPGDAGSPSPGGDRYQAVTRADVARSRQVTASPTAERRGDP